MLPPPWRRTRPSSTVRVLADEFAQIHGREPERYARLTERIATAAEAERIAVGGERNGKARRHDQILKEAARALRKDFHGETRTALCLSGGGIRSATFSLGAIEWLAQHDQLDKFHYLSTVSGGGYIGSWLSTWIAKEKRGWRTVRHRLKDGRRAGEEPREIRHLRENSRYLTQRSGLLSGDTWAAVAIWVRNLALNWSLILPLVAALALVPKILIAAIAQAAGWGTPDPFLALAGVAYATAVVVMAYNRPRWSRRNVARVQYAWMYQAPLVVAASSWAIGVMLAPWRPEGSAPYLIYAGATALLYGVAWAFAIADWRWNPDLPIVSVVPKHDEQDTAGMLEYEVRLSKPSRQPVDVCVFTEDRQAVESIHFHEKRRVLTFAPGEVLKDFRVHLIRDPAASSDPFSIEGRPISTADLRVLLRQEHGVTIAKTQWIGEACSDIIVAGLRGLVVGIGLAALHAFLRTLVGHSCSASAMMAAGMFAIPLTLLAHLIGTIAFIGWNNKTPKSENDREWHGRLDGFAIGAATAWMLWALIVVVAPYDAVVALGDGAKGAKWMAALLGSVGSAAAAVTAWIGKSAATPANARANPSDWRSRLVLPAAGTLFAICLFALISLGLDEAQYQQPFLPMLGSALRENNTVGIAACLARLCAVLTIVPLVLSTRINVNRFSLHAVYRNRLVRAFLGASNDGYKTQPGDRFTGFRETDNIEMQRLWDRRNGGGPMKDGEWRPFHVVNMALNVTSKRNLALQDRKALPFVATPLWCGAAALDADRGAFRRTSEFGGEEKTITVGTAMAISGAAVSPNMGYHSSPLVSLLLTLFNVRLGWWYGNPIDGETYRLEGPRWALKSLFYEAFGLANEISPYVYLSDGGHFDNLGLYEMVRRRCHVILAIDAGQDADCRFSDLSGTLARIKTDFGIEIEIDLKDIRKRNNDRRSPDDGGSGFAVGRIVYSGADGKKAPDGKLIYVKPSWRCDEPTSIHGYAGEHGMFPHETTADQWFTESQFESYRALGFEAMRRTRDARSQA